MEQHLGFITKGESSGLVCCFRSVSPFMVLKNVLGHVLENLAL